MNGIEYLRHIRRNWILLLACLLLGTVGAVAATSIVKPQYQSQTQLFVAIRNSGSLQELQQSNTFLRQRVQSYVTTAQTPHVLQRVIEDLGLPMKASQLSSKIEVAAQPNTVVLSITASDESPEQATAIAQGVAESLIQVVGELESSAATGRSDLKLTLLTPGEVPTAPVSPNSLLNLVIGVLAGLAAGAGLVALRGKFDTKLRGEEDLRRITALPILGGVALDIGVPRKQLLSHKAAQSPRAEAFRQIRTNLQFTQVSHSSKTVLITSSVPGEGKTCAAINLALTLAQAGQRVVVVDADLRRPRLGEYLGLEQNAGLTTALIGREPLDVLLQPYGENDLSVLTSGQIPPNPSELLGSPAMMQLIQHLERTYDAVIIDTPPLLPVTDAAVLAQHVGGVVLIVGAGKAKEADVRKALHALQMVDAEILGVILNRIPSKGPDAQTYKYGNYGKPAWGKKAIKATQMKDGPASERRPGAHELSQEPINDEQRITQARETMALDDVTAVRLLTANKLGRK